MVCCWPTLAAARRNSIEAFRTFAAKLFPDAKLEPIPPDDPLFGEEFNGRADHDGSAAARSGRTVRVRGRVSRHSADAFGGNQARTADGSSIYSKYDIGCALEKHASSDCKGYDHETRPADSARRRCCIELKK